ncbi:hypothetical protein [Chlamydia gallinacea]|uniref:Uncharacterized protein n=2 Tax=Chlamydia gallinacea TaxID=1457153 RepID=A0A173DZI7_9CHLA|nr:hypothetical protein [Chlamydia gallinacea]EYE62987.1 hypothetical protein M127_4870 [Bacteroides fragilis str. S6L5]ANG66339.1 hypothetical protein M787_003320 [Chlamydia gallinacea 08-1274/3]AQT77459.1 hypothetical protein B1F83_02275 [Chlamydia gallinacea]MBX6680449.1 hypothetical protein [Chlamydia gallinacea]MBX6687076.1 hypothetical protein [Chlamydia gallinacea]
MLKLFFHLLTLSGQLISTPIYMIHDALGIDKEAREASSQPRLFSLQMQYLQVENAEFKKLSHQSLGLRQSDASLLFTLPLNPQFGLLLSTGYVGVNVLWDHTQPKVGDPQSLLGYATFQDKSFYNYLMLSLGAYTVSLTNWQWSVMFSSLVDPENLEIGYSLHQAVLSGKYQATRQLSVVFGMINETGLHQEKAWPLIGASYKPNDQVTIHCIYPLNFSLEYKCTSVCDFGAAYRLTRFRKKLPKNHLASSEGIFEYQGREIEGNIKLSPWPGSFIKAFYGWSLGNDISLADSHNTQSTSYPFKTSVFFGGSAIISF